MITARGVKGYVVRGLDADGMRVHNGPDPKTTRLRATDGVPLFAPSNLALAGWRAAAWASFGGQDVRIYAVAENGAETPLPTHGEALTQIERLTAELKTAQDAAAGERARGERYRGGVAARPAPLTEAEARAWAEMQPVVDAWDAYFQAIDKQNKTASVEDANAARAARAKARRMSDILESAIYHLALARHRSRGEAPPEVSPLDRRTFERRAKAGLRAGAAEGMRARLDAMGIPPMSREDWTDAEGVTHAKLCSGEVRGGQCHCGAIKPKAKIASALAAGWCDLCPHREEPTCPDPQCARVPHRYACDTCDTESDAGAEEISTKDANVCTCPPATEYDPPCPTHGIVGFSFHPNGDAP